MKIIRRTWSLKNLRKKKKKKEEHWQEQAGGTAQKGDDSAGVRGKVAEETNVGQKRKKSVPVGLNIDLEPYVAHKRTQTAFYGKGI
eukprot:scaffold187882_cov50-Attheya_sp.AAC.2